MKSAWSISLAVERSFQYSHDHGDSEMWCKLLLAAGLAAATWSSVDAQLPSVRYRVEITRVNGEVLTTTPPFGSPSVTLYQDRTYVMNLYVQDLTGFGMEAAILNSLNFNCEILSFERGPSFPLGSTQALYSARSAIPVLGEQLIMKVTFRARFTGSIAPMAFVRSFVYGPIGPEEAFNFLQPNLAFGSSIVTQTYHPGDANLDGCTNFEDFLILSANFGTPGTWADGDFTGDGQVDFADFLVLSANTDTCEQH